MKGWISLAAFVAVYDTWAVATDHRTISVEFREASRRKPIVVSVATMYLLAHLGGYMPKKLDPLCGYIGLVKMVAR